MSSLSHNEKTANANYQQQQSWTQDALLIFQVWLLFVVNVCVRVCVSEPGRLTAELLNATGQQLCGKLTQRRYNAEEMQ